MREAEAKNEEQAKQVCKSRERGSQTKAICSPFLFSPATGSFRRELTPKPDKEALGTGKGWGGEGSETGRTRLLGLIRRVVNLYTCCLRSTSNKRASFKMTSWHIPALDLTPESKSPALGSQAPTCSVRSPISIPCPASQAGLCPVHHA